MNDTPWFGEGLRFRCTQCGDCCTGAPGYVWVNKAEMERLAEELGLPLDQFERQYVRKVGIRHSLVEHLNGDCVFFDTQTRKCRVYSARPRQCRTWPFWDSNVRSEEAWRRTSEICPGCNQGDLVPLEQVIQQVAVIRL
jgi:Fe-S-cluster containining protein